MSSAMRPGGWQQLLLLLQQQQRSRRQRHEALVSSPTMVSSAMRPVVVGDETPTLSLADNVKPRRPRGAAAACRHAVAAGWRAEEAQEARPRKHRGLRRRVRHRRRRARQRCAACARGAQACCHPRQRRGKASSAYGAGTWQGRQLQHCFSKRSEPSSEVIGSAVVGQL